MNKFDFYNPTHIVFGKDRLNELDKLVPKDARVLVLYGGGSAKSTGTLQKALNGLGERTVFEFGGIEPNPQFNTLMKAVEVVRQDNIDFLIAVGGGSVMDSAKFIALAAPWDQGKEEDLLFFGHRPIQARKAIRLGTVVTLPASGSEMNFSGVITHNQGKFVFSCMAVFPEFSFLDPTLTYSLPAHQIANGIVDTFVHTTEQYLTYPVNAGFQDRTAEGILQTLIEIGRKTIDEPEDYDARANLVWCATMALNGLIGAGVPQDWTSHMIGHEVTALFHIDHGRTLAVLLPSVLMVLKEQKRAKLLQYAERVWKISEGSEDLRIEEAITKTRKFFESLGVKTHLADYDISDTDIAGVVLALEKHGQTTLSEKRTVTLDISRQILLAAM